MIPLEHILCVSGAMFAMGIFGLLLQRSLLRILLALEAMINGAAFGLIGTAVHLGQTDGHVMFVMVLAIAAAEVGVGLAILLHCDRLFHGSDISLLSMSKE